ncbi:hypothetical protein HDU97_010230 [Phlyctochytrium planicorne]|nr:hypothetical protein HDU97_010230 [Phlyctochytrium planicorne]
MIGFSIPVFFVMFREATETAIVVSVLLSFINATFFYDPKIRRSLFIRVWVGTGLGVFASLAVGAAFLVLLYKYANNLWASAELVWEAVFSLVACVLLTVMSLAFLRYDTLSAKWTAKLQKIIQQKTKTEDEASAADAGAGAAAAKGEVLEFSEFSTATAADTTVANTTANESAVVAATTTTTATKKATFWGRVWGSRSPSAIDVKAAGNEALIEDSDDETTLAEGEKKVVGFGAMIVIPFVTVLREGLEGIFFLAGIAISEDPGTIPLAVIAGLLCGMIVGFILYRSGNTVKLHVFFVAAAILLLILAAGLLSKAVMAIEKHIWAIKVNALDDPDALTTYDVHRAIWHIECCTPANPGIWSLLNAISGWDSHATYSSIGTYIGYWLVLSVALIVMKLTGRKAGAHKHCHGELTSVQTELVNEVDAEVEEPKKVVVGEKSRLESEEAGTAYEVDAAVSSVDRKVKV